MAEEETVTKPPAGPPPKPEPVVVAAPPPAPPPPSVAEKARANIAAAKSNTSFIGRITRPFRYTGAFISGTITDGLNGLANWGQKGMKYGLVGGIIAGISVGALWPVVAIAVGAFLASAAVGCSWGLLTGGYKAVGRIHRGEKYAEDLIDRSKLQSRAPENRADYRAAYHDRKIRSGIFTQQILEREMEAARDTNTYWQDREHRIGNGHSRGF